MDSGALEMVPRLPRILAPLPFRAKVPPMRHFTSYGPVEPKANFAVERTELVERCVELLVGPDPAKSGYFFTIWGPRQTGKTWIMRRAIEEIRKRYNDQFSVGWLSMEGILSDEPTDDEFFRAVPTLLLEGGFGADHVAPKDWNGWLQLFHKNGGIFERPTILLIDEFDCLPRSLIDNLIRSFRRIYLNREAFHLHGLALIGVRAVLGVDSKRGSPFNIQRSLQIPNLTRDEVVEMFRQYQAESGQTVEPDVVEAVFESTRGQPGLMGWFGELLTEKYNKEKEKPIGRPMWRRVYNRALQVEWNNTVLNLLKKARGEYRAEVLKLFTDSNVPFGMDKDWCNYLYTNGILDETTIVDAEDPEVTTAVCRFSSPFVQLRLFAALSVDMFGEKGPLPAIVPGDWLADVFTESGIQVPALLKRYRDYLKRLKTKGIDPWRGQPRRADLHFTEAVGHFHLYAWLREAVGPRCVISPEFPTGNGKVDLVLRTKEMLAVLEVKSFRDMSELTNYRKQAAGYAKKLGIGQATLVLFAPTEDDDVLETLSGEADVDGVHVATVAFGWV